MRPLSHTLEIDPALEECPAASSHVEAKFGSRQKSPSRSGRRVGGIMHALHAAQKHLMGSIYFLSSVQLTATVGNVLQASGMFATSIIAGGALKTDDHGHWTPESL